MSSTTLTAARSNSAAKLIVPALVASLVMGMWQMIVEAFIPGGAGIWAAPTYIAATIFRNLQGVARPVPFDALGVAAGLMGHMMNSVIFGLIFALAIAPRFKSLVAQAIAGMVYGAVVFAAMWFVVAPLVDPVLLNLNAVVFFLGHLMWGVALGAVNYWATK